MQRGIGDGARRNAKMLPMTADTKNGLFRRYATEGKDMNHPTHLPTPFDRRRFSQRVLGGVAFGTAAFTCPGLFAELITTPSQTEGPFYPDQLPLDTDNDLLIINDGITPAVGLITHLTGSVVGPTGAPVRNALVEIWQVDNQGIYLHSKSPRRETYDSNFQGYGRFSTNAKGEYYFRTIKPSPYTGRTPHIHVAVSKHGRRILTTQCYVNGAPQNQRDGLVRRIRDPLALETVMVDFKPLAGSTIDELTARFDIVLGVTPEDPDHSDS
jgi:protocatechuate 3,4-dioxygenase beta subunit